MPTAFITGGAQGIGKAIAIRLLRAGYAVMLVDCDVEAGEETQAELAPAGAVRFQPADTACEADIAQAVAATLAWQGRLDTLVCNAGIMRGAPVEALPLTDWDRVLAVNLTGPFLCAKHAAAPLRASRGAIVNIASTRALMSEPHTEAYSASKGGLVALTHALAISLGPEIRVNSISPGWIDVSAWRKERVRQPALLTPQDHAQHPVGRVGTPEDVAELAAFLASPAAAFITGQNYVIDGGMTRKMIYE